MPTRNYDVCCEDCGTPGKYIITGPDSAELVCDRCQKTLKNVSVEEARYNPLDDW